MSAVKDKIKRMIDGLPEEIVKDLVPLVERMAEWEATTETLRDPDMMEQIRRSEEDLKKRQSVDWRDVHRGNV